MKDTWIWKILDNNEYSIKDTYKVLFENYRRGLTHWHNVTWNKPIPLEVFFHAKVIK